MDRSELDRARVKFYEWSFEAASASLDRRIKIRASRPRTINVEAKCEFSGRCRAKYRRYLEGPVGAFGWGDSRTREVIHGLVIPPLHGGLRRRDARVRAAYEKEEELPRGETRDFEASGRERASLILDTRAGGITKC